MSHSSEQRRALRTRVYHAPEVAVAVPEHRRGRTDATDADAREGLRAERARLMAQLAAVEAALREMGEA